MKNLMCLTLLLAIGCTTVSEVGVEGIGKIELPSADQLTDKDLWPVIDRLANRPVIMLGESIHLTKEFSVVRSKIVKGIHKKGEHRSLYFEGSPVEFWVATDQYLNSPRKQGDLLTFQKTALFGLWQTRETKEVLDYALGTFELGSEKWLYVSSYDVQIGQAKGFSDGVSLFLSLVGQLRLKGVNFTEAEAKMILELDGLTKCKARKFPNSEHQTENALRAIRILDSKLSGRRDLNSPHLKMMTYLPRALDFSLKFCQEVQTSKENYTQIRDRWSSQQFEGLLEKFGSNAIVWAHSGHVMLTPKANGQKTFGSYFSEKHREKIYSINFTAAKGKALSFMEESGEETEPFEVHIGLGEEFSLENKLKKVSEHDFFIFSTDLKNVLTDIETMRVETSWKTKINPFSAFDGYYLIQGLHTPNFLPFK